MLKNYSQLIWGILIGLIVGLGIAKLFLSNNNIASKSNTTIQSPSGNSKNNPTSQERSNSYTKEPASNPNAPVPAKVYEILRYVKDNGSAMDNYVGGRVFSNREKILPQQDATGKRISYQEWDVNPKVQGQNRGAERMVTGSDGRSWFTNDHYKSFTEIK